MGSLVERRCTICLEVKTVDHFYLTSNKKYYRGPCKVCFANKHFVTVSQDPIKARERDRRKLLRRYNLTPEAYDQLVLDQQGLCKICDQPDPQGNLCIDHDHSCCARRGSCGRCIRGLLCQRCNRVLGYVEDDPNLLEHMARYLESDFRV